MMEMLRALTTKLETPQVTVISKISGPSFEPKPSRIMSTTWSLFGIPPCYSPPFEEAPSVVHSTQHVVPLLLFTKEHPVIHTVATTIMHARVPLQFEDYHQMYHISESTIGDNKRNKEIKGVK